MFKKRVCDKLHFTILTVRMLVTLSYVINAGISSVIELYYCSDLTSCGPTLETFFNSGCSDVIMREDLTERSSILKDESSILLYNNLRKR